MKHLVRTLALFLLLLPASHASAQTVSNSEMTAFVSAALSLENDTIKTFLLRDSVLNHFYPDWESDSTMITGLRNDVSKADIDYMLKQRREFKPMTWEQLSVNGAVILHESYLDKTFSSKKAVKNWEKYYNAHRAGYYEISQPIFSQDKKTAVIYMSYKCGVTCGHGTATLYHYENGKWVVVRNLFTWINN